jgi:SHS family lactate transporter-like MFS transporter
MCPVRSAPDDSLPFVPYTTATIPEDAAPYRARWRALVAGFLGWMLDGYDFTVMTLVILDIQRDLGAGAAAIGALGTVTLLMRLVGGAAAGYAADCYGRRGPLMVSILWFSVFSALSGVSGSYAMLFAMRALFGLGMGGEWAAGAPLVLEHWPQNQRGVVSGVLQGAFSWGFILAAFVFHYLYPMVATSLAWRVMLWSGILPALLVLWIRRGVTESPVWLAERNERGVACAAVPAGNVADVLRSAVGPALVLAAVMFAYQSMTFWYATFLRQQGVVPLKYLVALNAGGIVGALLWGVVADTRLGRRGSIAFGMAAGLLTTPAYLLADSSVVLFVAALTMGLTGAGVVGLSPAYLAAVFPVSWRGRGAGTAYHLAAAVGAFAPVIVGSLQDRSWTLSSAMATCVVAASTLAIVFVWIDAVHARTRTETSSRVTNGGNR